MAEGFYRWEGRTLVLNILGRPNAKRTAIGRPAGKRLQVHVALAPRAGKATAHMVSHLAGVFGVAESAIEVVYGEKNVKKQLRIRNPKRLPKVIPPRDGNAKP